MDSSQKKSSADPFAADIFAGKRAERENEPSENPEIPNNWNRRLQKVSPSEIDWNKLWRNIPIDFFDALPRGLTDKLAQLLNLSGEKVFEFELLTKREINSAKEIFAEHTNSLWLTIVIEESGTEIYFEIDNTLATWLVDAILDEEISEQIKIRELTPGETAIIEFLSLNLAHETNRILQSPVFKYRSLSHRIPDLLKRLFNAETPSLLIADWQIIHELQSSIVKIHLTPEALKNLQTGENRLLDAPPRRRAAWLRCKSKIETVRMRLNFGQAELTFAELAALEKGDVVLLEKYSFSLQNKTPGGRAEIYLGDGTDAKIIGEIILANSETPENIAESVYNPDNKTLVHRLNFNHDWQITIKDFAGLENPIFFEKSMSEENENPLETAEENLPEQTDAGFAIENIAVTLRVELEARRLSLEEAGNLRLNQVLDLGVRPTDAVNLLLNDKIIGCGELVEVENRLGVRIIKLLR